MTYDTISIADCSNTFNINIITTQYYSSQVIITMKQVDDKILNGLYSTMITVEDTVQILCLKPIN